MNASSDQASRLAALSERVEEEVESWNPRGKPEQPRKIAGTFVERRPRPGRGYQGADTETVLIRDGSGKLWLIWMFHSVLQQELAGVVPGQLVAIKYEGHSPGGAGANGYERYSVSVDQTIVAAAPLTEPAPEPAAVVETACEACGFRYPHHAVGCPNEIPF